MSSHELKSFGFLQEDPEDTKVWYRGPRNRRFFIRWDGNGFWHLSISNGETEIPLGRRGSVESLNYFFPLLPPLPAKQPQRVPPTTWQDRLHKASTVLFFLGWAAVIAVIATPFPYRVHVVIGLQFALMALTYFMITYRAPKTTPEHYDHFEVVQWMQRIRSLLGAGGDWSPDDLKDPQEFMEAARTAVALNNIYYGYYGPKDPLIPWETPQETMVRKTGIGEV